MQPQISLSMAQLDQSLSENPAPDGFQISERPLVRTDQIENEASERLPKTYGTDLLYLVARDPFSLFIYWDLNWRRAFEQARVAPRSIHLRIYRENGEVEKTEPINPFSGHCYVDVSGAGIGYYCELGCFEGETWYSLARSGKAVTPKSEISEDLSTTFATLPIHLSFQRLLDIFQATKQQGKELAITVAEFQAEARNGGGKETESTDLAALLEAARQVPDQDWTDEQRAVWHELTAHLADARWSSASENDFGGSS